MNRCVVLDAGAMSAPLRAGLLAYLRHLDQQAEDNPVTEALMNGLGRV